MTDIVERLRETASMGIPDFTNSKLLDEAADEIERLQADLAQRERELALTLQQLERERG